MRPIGASGLDAVTGHVEESLSFINFAAREINCKIVYYGPGLGGKTTNLQHIFDKTGEQQKGKMISLATETDRTLFFDFLPLDLGTIRGFKTRFHLYTVPGQVFYDASRKLILRGVDGVVFVADSQAERADANGEALENLVHNLEEHGYDFSTIPYALQLNKRDLPNVLAVADMKKQLCRREEPVFESIASQGQGVFETLKEIARQVLVELKKS
jgi:signal recognition particle receptor subunit beta